MIQSVLPSDLERFVEEQVGAGRYQSPQHLVVSAVRMLRDVETREERFREEVRIGLEQLDAGDVTDYDDAGLRQLFDDLKQVARDRAAQGGATE